MHAADSMTIKCPPMPDETSTRPEQADLFFEKQAAFWSDRYASRSYQQRRELVLNIIRRELGNESNSLSSFRALDFGCGAGVLVEDLSNMGISVVGVDRSQPMIEAAQSRLAQSPVARLERICDHRPGEYRQRRYNLILCLSVLEFVRDPEALLEHLASLLSVGGLLILTVPNQNSHLRRVERLCFQHPKLTRWIPKLSYLAEPDCYLHHQIQQFKAEALVASARSLGFAIEDLRFHVAPKVFGAMERLESIGMMLMLALRKHS